jgi:hypothetical protein
MAAQAAGNLEVTLTSILLGPAVAGIYNITARIFRIARGFIGPIVGSTFSGLAHLLGERGPTALIGPLREVRGISNLVIAVVFPTMVFTNQDFVALWVGPEKFGGNLLCTGLALASSLSANLFFLYLAATAAGEVWRTAYLSAVEGAIRIPLMALGLYLLQLPGLPIATALGFGALTLYGYPPVLAYGFGMSRGSAMRTAYSGLPAALFCTALGTLGASFAPHAAGWPTLIVKAVLGVVAFACATLAIDPTTRRPVNLLWSRLTHKQA